MIGTHKCICTKHPIQLDLGHTLTAYILIDSGSTHSFVPMNFFKYINKKMDWLDSPLVVTMSMEESFIAEYMYKDYDIIVMDQILAADLILLPLKEFDAILGID